MPVRKTPEEMEFNDRISLQRTLVRWKYSRLARHELNGLLADMTEAHALELSTGGLKQIAPGTLEGLIKDVADLPDDGVSDEDRA